METLETPSVLIFSFARNFLHKFAHFRTSLLFFLHIFAHFCTFLHVLHIFAHFCMFLRIFCANFSDYVASVLFFKVYASLGQVRSGSV